MLLAPPGAYSEKTKKTRQLKKTKRMTKRELQMGKKKEKAGEVQGSLPEGKKSVQRRREPEMRKRKKRKKEGLTTHLAFLPLG